MKSLNDNVRLTGYAKVVLHVCGPPHNDGLNVEYPRKGIHQRSLIRVVVWVR